MRFAWMLFAVLCGCSDVPAPMAPMAPPQEMVDAIIADEPQVPPPPIEPGIFDAVGAAFDQHVQSAANTPPKPNVKLLTTSWCTWCKPAKRVVKPYLESQGCTVEIVDCTDEAVAEKYNAHSFPQYIFEVDGKEVDRVKGTGLDKLGGIYPSHFTEALRKCKPAPAVASFGMPTIELSEFSHLIAGKTFEFGSAAQLIVPANVTWTATPKPASVLLTFPEGRRPQLQVRKFIVIRMNPQILSVEIGPNFIELKTDSSASFLATARLNFDWSAPKSTVKKTAGLARYRPQPRYYQPKPQPQYRPVPQVQKPKPTVAPEPTPAPPEPVKLGKSVPVIVPVAHAWRTSVCVWVKRERTVVDFFGIQSVQEGKGCGSGMIVSPQGHLLTCAHVIDDVKSIEVEFCDGQKRPAELIESDKKTDLAILKVAGVDLPVVAWAADLPMIGADAYMVGNPHGRGESVARGVVAGFNRETESEEYKHSGLMQFSIAINPGNSGGPIVNSKGDVLGVINAMVGDHCGLDAQGIAFAIPTSTAKAFVDRVVKP